MTRTAWVNAPLLPMKHRRELEQQLGESASAYIEGAEDALNWYSALRHDEEQGLTPTEQQAQLLTIAKTAKALANALESLDETTRDLLEIRRERRRRTAKIPTPHFLLDLAEDAESAHPPIKRGVDGPKLILVRQLARHFELATGRRPGVTDNGPFARALRPVLLAAKIPSTNIRPLIKRAVNR